jgi:hypothetical protein
MPSNRDLLLTAIRNWPRRFDIQIDLLVVSKSPRFHEHQFLEDPTDSIQNSECTVRSVPTAHKKPVGRTSDQRVSQKRLFG